MGRVRTALALTIAALAAACASAPEEEERLAVEVYLHNAQGYVDGGHHDQALAQFRQALKVDPGNRKALLGEAFSLLYLGQEENPSAGARILEAAERIDRLSPDAYGENGWKVLLGQGMVHARLADLWERKAELRRQEPDSPDGRKETDEARANRDRERAEAERAFREVLRQEEPLARDNLTALFYLATASALRARAPADYDAALGYFRRYEVQVERSKRLWVESAKRDPEMKAAYEAKLHGAERQEIELRDLVANVHFKRRDHEASVGELNRILALDPDRATAYLNRGRNQEELGRFGAAADDYNKFLRLTDLPPDSPAVVEAAERMKACEDRVRDRLNGEKP